jgi:tetratricopeptide (TPR) repeat protein
MGAPEKALQAAERAVALLPTRGPSWHTAVATAVEAAALLGRADSVTEPLRELQLDTATPAESIESRAAALSRVSFALVLLGRAGDAACLVEEACRFAASGQVHEPLTLAHLSHALAAGAMVERRRESAARFYAEAADAFENSGALRLASGARANVAAMYLEMGRAELALPELDRAVLLAERTGALYTLTLARLNRAIALGQVGRIDEAIPVLTEVRTALVQMGDRRLLASASCALSEMLARTGRLGEARALALDAISACEELPGSRAGALATLSLVLLQEGKAEEALGTARDADALRQQTTLEERDVLLDWVLSEAAARVGHTEEARQRIGRVAAALEQQAAEFATAERKRAFLEGVPENSAIFALKRRLDETAS